MAKYNNSDIDIDANTWAEQMGVTVGDGTFADVLEETKIDEGATVPASQIKTRVGALYGNVVGRVLEEVWDKARSGGGDVTGSDSYSSDGTNYHPFAELGEIPEGQAVAVVGEVLMMHDTGSLMYSEIVVFRTTARRRTGGTLSADTAYLSTGTGTGYADETVTSNELTMTSRYSLVGTVYRSWRYRVMAVDLP